MSRKVYSGWARVWGAALCAVALAACGGSTNGRDSGVTSKTPADSGSASPTAGSDPQQNGTPTTGIEVKGLVLNEDGNPVDNNAVLVLSSTTGAEQGRTSTSDGGKFTVAGVTPPYDLVVAKDSTRTAYIYKNLTRADPTIFMWTLRDQTRLQPHAATLSGVMIGGDDFDDPTYINFASPEIDQWYNPDAQATPVGNAQASAGADGSYYLDLRWNDPVDPAVAGVTVGNLLALQYQPDPGSATTFVVGGLTYEFQGLPTAYWYDYQPGVTVLGDQPSDIIGPRMMLKPTATDNVQGTVATPGRYSLDRKYVGLQFPGGINFLVFEDLFAPSDRTWNYIVPDIAGATTQVCANATDGLFPGALSVNCKVVTNDDGVMALDIREAPEPQFPYNNGAGITYSTLFQWTPVGEPPDRGIHIVAIVPPQASAGETPYTDHDVAAAPKFVIVTDGTNVNIPDLSSIGMGLPGTTPYTWFIRGIGPFDDIDAFATYPVAVPRLNSISAIFAAPPAGQGTGSGNELAPEPDVFWSRSATYAFKTGCTSCQ